MATYKKLLKNRAGDTIIPVVDVLNYLYPVGSIYMSATMSTVAQVEAAFGGTWVAWGAGRVPVGVDPNDTSFDTVEETGGEKTHLLSTNEMPRHVHMISRFYNTTGFATPYGAPYSGWGLKSNDNGGQNDIYTTKTGGNDNDTTSAHNNLQPYITCYMYKRTA